MRTRFISEINKHSLIVAVGLAYYIWGISTGLYIPCVFRLLTGFKCPGCGITHMIVAALQLDFVTAFYENPLLFVTLPFMGIIYITNKVYYIKNGIKMKRGKIIISLEWIMIFLMVIFAVVRNIPMD